MENTTKTLRIRLINAALDQIEGGGDILIRGSIDPGTLDGLQTAPYQREILPLASKNSLAKAFREGTLVPDVELGMRGGDFKDVGGGVFELLDPTFIIDGLQRVSAARGVLKDGLEGKTLRLGAKVYCNTTEAWERERFRVLNVDRRKLSPNVLLRNMREELAVVELLYRLSDDRTFVLGGKVCWTQAMTRDQLINALTMAKALARLHAHVCSGARGSKYEDIAYGLQAIVDAIGPNIFRANVRAFFDLIDTCYGIKTVHFKEGAVQLRAAFLACLASILSDHTDFWRENKLFIEKDLQRKLAQFPMNDPQIRNLASAAGGARAILYELMVKHLNKGKTTRRLTARSQELVPVATDAERASLVPGSGEPPADELEEENGDGAPEEAATGT